MNVRLPVCHVAAWVFLILPLRAAADRHEPLLTARLVAVHSVESRLTNAPPAKAWRRFSNWSAAAVQNGTLKPNPSFWAKGVDFSCASFWNTQGRNTRAGTAVSARHVVFAHHFPIAAGTTLMFFGTDGQIHHRKITASRRISTTDLMVGVLESDLPRTVHPALILPPNWRDYLGSGAGLPVVTFDYEEKGLVMELNAPQSGRRGDVWSARHPVDPARAPFTERLIVGDSGNPCFLLMNEDVILLYTITTGGPGGGPAIQPLRAMLQYAMDQLCPGYRLREYDFSSYTSRP